MSQLLYHTINERLNIPPPYTTMNLKTVAIGGGTGLSVLLQGLKLACFSPEDGWSEDRDRLTAVVTVSDDGGSSGKLRNAYNILAPGDIRNCLLALSNTDITMKSLFNFRFNGEVGGHSLGNLILTALSQMENDFPKAVEKASEILHVRGKVLPATYDNVNICAEYSDGSCSHGECQIVAAKRPIQRVRLVPDNVRALPQVSNAIKDADLIIIGPGSLYTSLLPTLLVNDIAEALSRSHAMIVLVMNLMTETGETDGYTATDILYAIRQHIPKMAIHTVLINDAPIRRNLIGRYHDENSVPIVSQRERIIAAGCRPVESDLLDETSGTRIRHDPYKLARAFIRLVE